jgi:hypothetical protein
MLVRLYLGCDRCVSTVLRAIMVLHRGIWLGLLKDRDLDRLTQAYYDRVPRYVDAAYNLSGLHDWEQRMIAAHFAPGSSILVASAGAGREVVGLCRAGYKADGFDCNETCVREGRKLFVEQGLSSELMLVAPSSVPQGLTRYDGVIIGWGGYMHIRGRSRRIEFLMGLIQRMRAGAPFLVSVFHQDRKPRSHIWVACIANLLRRIRRSDQVEPGDWLDGSFDHYFTKPELISELADVGLVTVAYEVIGSGYGVAIARFGDAASANQYAIACSSTPPRPS